MNNTNSYVILVDLLQIDIFKQNREDILYDDIDNRILIKSSNYYRIGSVRIAIFTYYLKFQLNWNNRIKAKQLLEEEITKTSSKLYNSTRVLNMDRIKRALRNK